MALLRGQSPSQLTLGDALSVGFGMVTKVNFIVPILIIGTVVNAVIAALLAPFVPVSESGAVSPTLIAEQLGPLALSVLAGIIGTILLNLYGQVWAVMASLGAEPTFSGAMKRVGERWLSILGAGILVFLITFGLILGIFLAAALVTGLLAALLGDNAGIAGLILFVVFLAALILVLYVTFRLAFVGWLAAEGSGAVAAIGESWAMSRSHLGLIAGWSIVLGIVFGIVGIILSLVLGLLPIVGPALGDSLSAAFGYGSGVILFRRVRAFQDPAIAIPPAPPGPTWPAPNEPAPTEPAPTEPAPTEPAATEVPPTEVPPTEPAPTEPAPIEGPTSPA